MAQYELCALLELLIYSATGQAIITKVILIPSLNTLFSHFIVKQNVSE